MNDTKNAPTISRRTVMFLVFMASVLCFSLKHGPQPLVPFIGAEFAKNPAEAGLLVAVEFFGTSLMLLAIFAFSDFFDRKKISGLALLGASGIAILMGFSDSFSLLVACRFAQGLMLGTFPALIVAYINEEFGVKDAAMLIGLYVAGSAGGGMLGRVYSTLAIARLDWRTTLIILGISSAAVALFYIWKMPKPSHVIASPQANSFNRVIRPLLTDKRVISICFIAFVLMGCFGAIYTYITFTLLDAPYNLTKTQLAPLFLMQIFGCISSSVTGRSLARHQHGRLVALGLVTMLCGAGISATAPLAAKFIGLSTFIAGLFCAQTSAASWLTGLHGIPKGPASSLYMFCYYVGGSILTAFGGIVFQAAHWLGVVALIFSFSLAALLVLRQLENRLAAMDSDITNGVN